MSRFLKNLATVAQGINLYDEQQLAKQKAEEDRQYQLELREQARIDRERKDAEYQEAQELKQGLKERALPGEISSTEQVVEDESGGHSKKTYSFGGKQFDSEEEAKKFATDPVNVLRRQSAFLAERGLTQDAVKYGQLAQAEEDARLKRKETDEARQFGLQADERIRRVFLSGGDPWENALQIKRGMEPGANFELQRSGNKITVLKDGSPIETYTNDNEGKLRLAQGLYGARTAAEYTRMMEVLANRDIAADKSEADRQIRALQASATLARLTGGAGGTGGTRGTSTRAPSAAEIKAEQAASRSPAKVAMDEYATTFKEIGKDGGQAPLPADVNFNIESLAKYNPNMTASQLQYAAVKLATNPASAKFTFDSNGRVVKSFVDPQNSDVNFVVQRVPVEGLSKDDREALKAQAPSMLRRVVGSDENIDLMKRGIMGGDETSLEKLRSNWYLDAVEKAKPLIKELKRREEIKAGRSLYGGGQMPNEAIILNQYANRIIDERLDSLRMISSLFTPPKAPRQDKPSAENTSSSQWSSLPGIVANQVSSALWGSK